MFHYFLIEFTENISAAYTTEFVAANLVMNPAVINDSSDS